MVEIMQMEKAVAVAVKMVIQQEVMLILEKKEVLLQVVSVVHRVLLVLVHVLVQVLMEVPYKVEMEGLIIIADKVVDGALVVLAVAVTGAVAEVVQLLPLL